MADYNANNPTKAMKTEAAYSYNNEGELAKGANAQSLGKYLDTLSTNTQKVEVKDAATCMPETSDANSTTIFVYKGTKCDGNTGLKASGARTSAVVDITETASGYQYYCSDAS